MSAPEGGHWATFVYGHRLGVTPDTDRLGQSLEEQLNWHGIRVVRVPLAEEVKGGIEPFLLSDQVDALTETARDAAEEGMPVAVGGHSQGAFAAMVAAAEHPIESRPPVIALAPPLGGHVDRMKKHAEDGVIRQPRLPDVIVTDKHVYDLAHFEKAGLRVAGLAGVVAVAGQDRRLGPQVDKLNRLCEQNPNLRVERVGGVGHFFESPTAEALAGGVALESLRSQIPQPAR